MNLPPESRMTRRRKALVKLLLTAIIILLCGNCLEGQFVRVFKKAGVYDAHMWWMSLQPAIDLPVGQDYPIPLSNQLVDPRTGRVIQTCDWLDDNLACLPVPERPGEYRQRAGGNWYCPTVWRTFSSTSLEHADRPAFGIKLPTEDDRTITRSDEQGQILWSRTVTYWVPSWYVLPVVEKDRIFLHWAEGDGDALRGGILALDLSNGHCDWRSEVDGEVLCASDNLVIVMASHGARFVASNLPPESDYTVSALRMADGAAVWTHDFTSESGLSRVASANGLFAIGTFGLNIFFDMDGRERFRLLGNEEVILGQAEDEDLVLLTNHRLARFTRDGDVVWETSFGSGDSAGSLHELPGGDLLCLSYSSRSDRCETVARVSPTNGAVKWSSWCGSIGVSHSAYRHDAHIEVRGDWVYVIGQASAGDTVTILDLDSGWEERRWIYHYARNVPGFWRLGVPKTP